VAVGARTPVALEAVRAPVEEREQAADDRVARLAAAVHLLLSRFRPVLRDQPRMRERGIAGLDHQRG